MSNWEKIAEHLYTLLHEAEALAAEMKGELDKLTQELYDSKYLAASRLKLLEEVKQLLDVIYAEDIISSGDLGKVYEKVAEEVGDRWTKKELEDADAKAKEMKKRIWGDD